MLNKKHILALASCLSLAAPTMSQAHGGGAAVGAGLFGLGMGTMIGAAASRPSREVVYVQKETATDDDTLKGQVEFMTDAMKKLQQENAQLKKDLAKLMEKMGETVKE